MRRAKEPPMPKQTRTFLAALMFAAASAAACGPASAHGDHGAAPPGVVVIAPRAEARNGPVEMVAEFTGGTLAVFLSRYADGAPVTGAKVEVSTDLQSATLTESDAGIYVTKDILFADGRNDLSVGFSVSGAAARTQAMTINIVEPPHPAAPPPAAAWLPTPSRGTIEIGVAAVLAAAAAAGLTLARRRRSAVRIADGALVAR
jgi:cobalt-zinc-cadmium efflux system membrane fusion protein